MTEKEAIENIKNYIRKCNYTWTVESIFGEYTKHINGSYVSYTAMDVIGNCHRSLEKLSIKALEEIQQYREIGTVNEVKEAMAFYRNMKESSMREIIEKCAEYEKIGTVDECREAREKQKPKKPEYYGDLEDGKILCPDCQEDLFDLKECGFNTCPYCGQAIDWSEEE